MLFLPLGVLGLIFARLVVGFGDGWVFTAGVTWIVDLAPEERRGQAIGIFGLAIWGGLTFGSLIGEGVYSLGGYDAVWAFATLAPSPGCSSRARSAGRPARRRSARRRGGRAGVPARPRRAAAPRRRDRRAAASGASSRRVAVRPGIALALANVGYGTMAGFVVLLLDDRGVGSGASVFTVFAGIGRREPAAARAAARTASARGCSAFGAGLAAGAAAARSSARAQTLPMALARRGRDGHGHVAALPLARAARHAPRRRRAARRGARRVHGVLRRRRRARRAVRRASSPRSAAARTTPPRSTPRRPAASAGALIGFVSSRDVPEAHGLMARVLAIRHPGGGTSGVFAQAAAQAGHVIEEWTPALAPGAAARRSADYDALRRARRRAERLRAGPLPVPDERDRVHPRLARRRAGRCSASASARSCWPRRRAARSCAREPPRARLVRRRCSPSDGARDPVLGFGSAALQRASSGTATRRGRRRARRCSRAARAALQAFRLGDGLGRPVPPRGDRGDRRGLDRGVARGRRRDDPASRVRATSARGSSRGRRTAVSCSRASRRRRA